MGTATGHRGSDSLPYPALVGATEGDQLPMQDAGLQAINRSPFGTAVGGLPAVHFQDKVNRRRDSGTPCGVNIGLIS